MFSPVFVCSLFGSFVCAQGNNKSAGQILMKFARQRGNSACNNEVNFDTIEVVDSLVIFKLYHHRENSVLVGYELFG